MSKDPRRAQKAALKRRQREKEVREDLARKKAQAAEAGKDSVTRASGLPVADCVISKGWRERGLAHILVARELPSGQLVAAGYYVDVLCELARAWNIDEAWKESAAAAWELLKQQEYDPESIQDDNEVRRLYSRTGWASAVMIRTI